MSTTHQPLFADPFLARQWAADYARFRGSSLETELIQRLKEWAAKKSQKETAAEGAFISLFFKQTWGYRAAGEVARIAGYTCDPQHAIKGAGQGGGTGIADLALGYFDRPGVAPTPQVLCEFKGVRAGLDAPQKRKGNDRSPVKQCADYIKEAGRALYPNEPIQPTWGIVSDMNEFRLYWRNKMPQQYQRFVLRPTVGDGAASLLGEGDEAAFQRFTFWRMFQHDMLLTTGGPSPLEKLLTEQWVQEHAIENEFYREYQAYREAVFNAIVDANRGFKGTRGKLVRLTQRFLDRCIFILFCEDMGGFLKFPSNLLRDVLAGVSTDPDYDPEDDAAWTRVKKLFVAMRDGGPFRSHQINRFNGGLFAHEADLESLHIPTRLFCARGQGASPERIDLHKKTLLFFSAHYNFGVSGGTLERSVNPYTLGHIFEQSITELEFMEAKAEGRASISELSRRKRDGVYYTPEWITSYIVEETVGAHLAELRRELGLDPTPVFTEDELARYRKAREGQSRKTSSRKRAPGKDQRFKAERVEEYISGLDQLGAELDNIKVVDPACGSGAFLIQALKRLVKERKWIANERERVRGKQGVELWDDDAVTKRVLSNNIYGVDINEESVEITRLALWLHTALPDRALSALDENIRCGNSLIDRQFYKQEKLFDEEERERINAFDWMTAFPEIWSRPNGKSGFDCVIGNPPYVKLQHFRQALPDVAEYLLSASRAGVDGAMPLYASTQTQNFDMYLPFIEKGIELLNEEGRMGFIAPSVWLLNEYGAGLRRDIKRTRRLERWVDFKDFPVFDEAMTYTALQFYRGKACDAVCCAFTPDGELGGIDWSVPDAVINYADLASDEAWVLLPERERAFVNRLSAHSLRLDTVAPGIIVGIQTSADHIYHLQRLGPGRYRQFLKKKPPIDVELEDAIVRPLVSGEDAKRYQTPVTDTYLLFPYIEDRGRMRLLAAAALASEFPKAWQYLCRYEAELRGRENGAFDDGEWYRFGRNQNIDKQNLPKLGVAQTVPGMRVFNDVHGAYCFNNVRVNGILVDSEESSFFLMGILNCRVVDFVFRRIARPKERRPSGAYFEANRQYIAPLPIPRASNAARARVAAMAQQLQTLHSARRDAIRAIELRLASDQFFGAPRPPSWLWADVGAATHRAGRKKKGPARTTPAALAKPASEERLAAHLDEMASVMSFGATMSAALRNGELKFYVHDRCVISGVYVSEREAPVILAQWRQKARDTFVSESVTAAKVVEWLLDLKETENAALIEQVATLNRKLDDLEGQIRQVERALDDLVYDLYELTKEERIMVELDTRPRWDARMPMPPD
jgi:Eco57I restriction-modification methylase